MATGWHDDENVRSPSGDSFVARDPSFGPFAHINVYYSEMTTPHLSYSFFFGLRTRELITPDGIKGKKQQIVLYQGGDDLTSWTARIIDP